MYTAIIVEPRKHPAMEFVMRNFLENLDSRWSFIIFHGTKNKEWLMTLLDSKFQSELNRISLRPMECENLTKVEYSKLLTSKAFNEEIPTETFLIFQTDTMICPAEKDLIYQFIDYDYVGSPWRKWVGRLGGHVGNGGLSLRKKSKMLEIIEKVPYPEGYPEDLYFCGIDHTIPMNKPSWIQAQLFAIESQYSSRSFGLHNTWLWIPAHMLEKQFPGYHELVRLNKKQMMI